MNDDDEAGEGSDGFDERAPFEDDDPDAPNLMPESGLPPRVLPGGIELREVIGEGGMGKVYQGFHMALGLDVAVKILDPALRLRADSQERLLREGLVLAAIQHPNIVRVLHCDRTARGELFIVMELLRGETLRQLRLREDRLDPLRVVDIGLAVCSALRTAHEQGVVHRDFTPSNVMVLREPAGLVKVIDFGICRVLDSFFARHSQRFSAPPGSRLATPVGLQFGNPEYMAPELLVREPFVTPNFATDVFSVGVVLFELLTDRHPFVAGNRSQARRVRDVLPGFEYAELELALANALRGDPERRTPTMSALYDDLELARDCILAQFDDESADLPAPRCPSLRLIRLPTTHADDQSDMAEDSSEEASRARRLSVVPPSGSPVNSAETASPSPKASEPKADLSAPMTDASPVPRELPVAAAFLPLPGLPSSTPPGASGWLAIHTSSLLLGAGIVVGVGGTLLTEKIGDSVFTTPAMLAHAEAAAELCEQDLADVRATLARTEAGFLLAPREPQDASEPPASVLPESPSMPLEEATSPPVNVLRQILPAVPRTRHRAVRRTLDRTLGDVRICYGEFGGARIARLEARIKIEADGQASIVELPGKSGSSLIDCVTAAIRTRRYAIGDDADWIRHTFVFEKNGEQQ